jgi:thiol:disulfide interchange protein DsbD
MLGAFALLMVALSLSMFGVYQLQVPAVVQSRLTSASDRQSAGKLVGVFTMGAISALIVGPCVAAPLAGALLYISQTRDVLIGGSALFAMAVGMSVPLLLVGISAGALLPRAGAWMQAVKIFFGVLMLGLALWIVTPVIPGWVPMVGWAALGLGYGVYLLRMRQSGVAAKAAGLVFAVFGMVQLAGVATGGRDALAPLAHLSGNTGQPEFIRVKSVAELDAAIVQARGKPVMLDFYADWCVSCKEMEKLTFSDPRIQARFTNMRLLQADVTANNNDDKALLKRFRLFGPPGIIFFNRQGHEIAGTRVIGYQNAEKFLGSLALTDGS